MRPSTHVLLQALDEADVLRVFAAFCNKYSTIESLKKLRNIYYRTDSPIKTTQTIAERDLHANLPPKSIERLNELVIAYLKKSSFRQPIADSERKQLLIAQEYHCAICGSPIDVHAHADHIVPFKYVGDELDDNLQMLCSTCNEKKNAKLYYQIQHYLGLI